MSVTATVIVITVFLRVCVCYGPYVLLGIIVKEVYKCGSDCLILCICEYHVFTPVYVSLIKVNNGL